jgi:transposase
MDQRGTVTMSMRELDRLKVIQAVVGGELRAGLAAERLGMCARQVRRLAQRYRMEGPVGLTSRRRHKPSNRRIQEDLENDVARILRDQYPDFGPTLAMEKLAERHQIVLAKETVRRIQIAAGLWIPRRLRPPKIQQPRTRRACVGELIQIDGCEHAWFEDRAPMCTTLVFVDDATSRLMCVRFASTESTFTYFEALRDYLGRHGKPLAFYSDKATIFRVNRPEAASGCGHTQFARALFELNIDGICANTPAAKGRVERAHQTLQDRLVKELRLAGVSSIEAANALMPAFIEAHNRKFAKIPRDPHDAHRPVRPEEDLDLILACRYLRKVSQSLTLHYESRLHVLRDTAENRRLIGKYVEVFHYPDGRIEVRVAGQALPYSLYSTSGRADPDLLKQGAVVENKRLSHALATLRDMQSRREPRTRRLSIPTTHRANGSPVPPSKVVASHPPLRSRSRTRNPELLAPLPGRQTAGHLQTLNRDQEARKADIST